MVKIVIENLAKKELEADDLSRTVLQHLQNSQVDWMFSCGAKGRCTTCKMIIISGQENLSPPSLAEQNYSGRGFLGRNERLSCQARISGDIRIRVPDEYKLPHISYSE
jgi:ferredoxin, 2Fe-2S